MGRETRRAEEILEKIRWRGRGRRAITQRMLLACIVVSWIATASCAILSVESSARGRAWATMVTAAGRRPAVGTVVGLKLRGGGAGDGGVVGDNEDGDVEIGGGGGGEGGGAVGAGPKSFARRDMLVKMQQEAQERWDREKLFESDAPNGESSEDACDKYFVTFPYPYMNGLLHLGHAFSLTKV